MIFAYSFIAFFIGAIVIRVFGTGVRYVHNAADHIGALAILGGLCGMGVSLLMLAARFLP